LWEEEYQLGKTSTKQIFYSVNRWNFETRPGREEKTTTFVMKKKEIKHVNENIKE